MPNAGAGCLLGLRLLLGDSIFHQRLDAVAVCLGFPLGAGVGWVCVVWLGVRGGWMLDVGAGALTAS